jgi:thiamine-monophosphate kinase
LVARYRRPRPRLSLGLALRGLASASLDVSDGLMADLAHLAGTSGVRVEIDASRIPLSAALRALWGGDTAAISRAASAGDDYEIAFTAMIERRDAVLAASARSGVAVTEIGRVTAGEGVVLLGADGREIVLPRKGFVHF